MRSWLRGTFLLLAALFGALIGVAGVAGWTAFDWESWNANEATLEGERLFAPPSPDMDVIASIDFADAADHAEGYTTTLFFFYFV